MRNPCFLLLSVILSIQRALVMQGDDTSVLSRATFVELAVLAIALFIGIWKMNGIGAIVAVVAMIAGRLGSIAALWWPCLRAWRSMRLLDRQGTQFLG